jgi:hypothetical protein
VKSALTWLQLNILVVALVGGSIVTIAGATIAVAAITAKFLGTWAAIGLAATVGGAGSARFALAWSRLAVVEEAGK